MALAIVLLVWLMVRLLRSVVARIGRRARFRKNLVEVLQMVTSTVAWFTGGLIALTVVFPSITPGGALTTLGLGSVAIGFAFKDTFENFLAGILILLREPFQIGDFIECEALEGRVEAITIRDTRIRQTDGQLVVMPNHALFQNPVTVRTDLELRRVTIIVGVAYGEDVDASREVIHDAVIRLDSVRDDVHDVQVFAQAFGSSSIDFEVAWWTGLHPARHPRLARPGGGLRQARARPGGDRDPVPLPDPHLQAPAPARPRGGGGAGGGGPGRGVSRARRGGRARHGLRPGPRRRAWACRTPRARS